MSWALAVLSASAVLPIVSLPRIRKCCSSIDVKSLIETPLQAAFTGDQRSNRREDSNIA